MQHGDLDDQYVNETYPRRDWARNPLIIVFVALLLFGLGFGAFLLSADQMSDDETSTGGIAAADSEDDGGETEDGSGDATEAGDGSETESDAEANATEGDEAEATAGQDTANDDAASDGTDDEGAMGPKPDGAFVEATLNLDAAGGPGLFTLRGRVPDQATADAVLQSAEVSYAPFVESDLEVDDSLEAAPWLAASPALIGLLPSVTDGTIRVADGKIMLDARSPNPQYLAALEGALEFIGQGMDVEVVAADITDLEPPLFDAVVRDDTVTLTGYVPSEEIRALLAGGAAAAYGEGNVVNELTIDPGTYISFWMYTMPGIFQLFSIFPQYNLHIEDGISSGTLQGGVNFAVDSTEISPQAAQVLNIGVAVLARDLSIFMTVEGHTDSSGPSDYNQALSLVRSESVIAYIAAAGIDPNRLQAIGAGEDVPIATNDTDEGKALNRRVEFIFGPPPSG